MSVEDFNLDDALRAESSTPRDEQIEWPECGSVDVNRKQLGARGGHNRKRGDYRCRNGHHFTKMEALYD